MKQIENVWKKVFQEWHKNNNLYKKTLSYYKRAFFVFTIKAIIFDIKYYGIINVCKPAPCPAQIPFPPTMFVGNTIGAENGLPRPERLFSYTL